MSKRITALLLTVIMALSVIPTAVLAAEKDEVESETAQEIRIGSKLATVDYQNMTFDEIYDVYLNKDKDGPNLNYLSEPFNMAGEKLASMVKVYTDEERNTELWYEYYTGEVAIKNTKTGQILFTNPYDISAIDSTASAEVKKELLSQLTLTFLDNGTTKTFNSYNDAASKGQIRLKPIKGGIRVEYTIGDEATTYLVPRMIEKNRFDTLIHDKITNPTIQKKMSGGGYYVLYDINDPDYSEGKIRNLLEKWPILEKMAIYIFDDSNIGYLKRAESYVKTYCPEYSYDDLEYDHELTGYTGNDEAPPNFKMALEYIVTDDGVDVRLPANGIRFDESVYQLTSVSVLPYMGAGHSRLPGYTFVPDGSGALIRFEDITSSYNISGEMYGSDYSYHEIVGQHAEVMRYPVYGVVSNAGEEGFVAIITEGDSMARVLSTHGGNMHNWNSVYATFNPRPYDTYSLSGSSTADGGASWTVTSKRRYTGSYRIKYIMLTDSNLAEISGLDKSYEPSYVGMAHAYQDYLVSSGQLTALTKDDVSKDLPLYVESFGSMQTDDRFLSVPIKVDTALTTFDDVKSMYDDLAAADVDNVNFRLTGFANGGLEATVPYKLDWMRVLGGDSGFQELLDYSKEKNFGLYPNFDFTYMTKDTSFDGFSLKKHAVKTIDGRYTSKRYYDAATQEWQNDFAIAVSPASFDYLYSGLSERLDKYGLKGISVGTLGTDLNSDFDEDDPYNREDSKRLTQELLGKIGEKYKVMVDGGNAYTFPYADTILGMSMESSKYVRSSESVPFIGMVLHGYVNTTGGAFNMEGDIDSAFLHAIENGSSLYFILSYRNTELLKESVAYSNYYSVGYDVWKDEMIEYYKRLNEAIADLQTVRITDHHDIQGLRIPDEDELEEDARLLEEAIAQKAEEDAIRAAKAELKRLRDERRRALGLGTTADIDDSAEDNEDDESSDETDAPVIDDNEGEGDQTLDLTSKYLTTQGTVIYVEYENGVGFILNFNSFDISVELDGTQYQIGSLGYVRIEA